MAVISDDWKDPKSVAESIRTMAPRLALVTFRVAISHGLYVGANNALLSSRIQHNHFHEIAAGYRQDAAAMTALRLCALLDRGKNIVSYQTVHDKLKAAGVAQELTAHMKAGRSAYPLRNTACTPFATPQ